VYDWDAMRSSGFDWLRRRARRSSAIYSGYRIDHLVGFYRTYAFPNDGQPAFFTPADETDQLRLGEEVMAIFKETGAQIIAEDLGTVPDFVRESITRLAVPGYRVLRWEREWKRKDQPFRDPAKYPAISVATSGTHDTDPMAIWWETATADERRKVFEIPSLKKAPARDNGPLSSGAAHHGAARRISRAALPVRFGPADRAGAGHLRLARPSEPSG
jgi:4-alpha-glucanotransferase